MTGEEAAVEKEASPDDRFEGYGSAADYIGIARNTLSSYVARGIGPEVLPERKVQGQYNLPVFTRASLDEWMSKRPGQGARTDLVTADI